VAARVELEVGKVADGNPGAGLRGQSRPAQRKAWGLLYAAAQCWRSQGDRNAILGERQRRRPAS